MESPNSVRPWRYGVLGFLASEAGLSGIVMAREKVSRCHMYELRSEVVSLEEADKIAFNREKMEALEVVVGAMAFTLVDVENAGNR